MANFTINDNPLWVQYTASNGQTEFNIPFAFINNADIFVWLDEVLLEITTDYTLTGANTSSGGEVTLVVPAVAGEVVTIQNKITPDRMNIYIPVISNLTGDALNTDFNRDVLMISRAITTIDYLMLQYPAYVPISQDIDITKDRLIPLLDDGAVWRMALDGSEIISEVLPDIPIGVTGVFTTDNALVRVDLTPGDTYVQQSNITLSDSNTLLATTGDLTLASANDTDITATTNISLLSGGTLSLNGMVWPTSGAAQYKGLRIQPLSSTLLEWVYFLSVTGTPTDNHVVRFDGGSGAVQDSAMIIDDAGAATGLTSLTVDNIVVNGNTISTTSGDLTLAAFTNGLLGTADPTVPLGLATKQYVDAHPGIAGGTNGQLQYNDAGVFGGDTITTDGAGNWTGTLSLTGQLNADNLRLDGNTLSSTDTDGDVVINPNGTGAIDLSSATVYVGTNLIHSGDTNNLIAFGTDTQDFQTGGSSRMDISDAGVRLGGANSRVTTILDEDNMVSDSATALATQQSIKAYVDAHISPGVPIWSTIAGTTQAAVVNCGYVVGNAAQTTITLPATFAVGQQVIVEGLGAGGWIVQADAGDTIVTSGGTTSSGGTLTCALAAGNAYLVGLVADTTWKLASTNTSLAIA